MTTYKGIILDKGGAVHNVKAYGTLGDGSTDDTASINDAIIAAGTSPGGVVFLPAGDYKISSTLTLSGHLVFVGAGKDLTTIAPNFKAGDNIVVSSGSHVTIGYLQIIPTVTPTSGSGIHLESGHNCVITDFAMTYPYVGVYLDNTDGDQYTYKVQNFELDECVSAGIVITSSESAVLDVFISNGDISQCGGQGLYIAYVSGLYVSNVDITGSKGSAVYFYPGTSQSVLACFFDTILADSSTGCSWLFSSSTGSSKIADININNCWASSNAQNGFLFENGAANGIIVANSRVIGNREDGIHISDGVNIAIDGCQIFNNGTGTANTYSGVAIEDNVYQFRIVNCDIGLGGEWTSNAQKYGIWIDTTTDKFVVVNNRLPGNVVGFSNNSTGVNTIGSPNIDY